MRLPTPSTVVTAAPYREQMGTRHAVTEKCLCMRNTRKIRGSNTVLTLGKLGNKEGQGTAPCSPKACHSAWGMGKWKDDRKEELRVFTANFTICKN